MDTRIIQLKNITMMFGRVTALERVNLHVDQGEVLGLLGDNGAGKSTLIKIVAGLHAPTAGEIYVRGEQVTNWNTERSRNARIETVFQDRALTVQQSITANIFMGRELTMFLGFVNLRKQRREARKLMEEIGFTSKIIGPDSVVGHLSGGERQGVAIARAFYNEAELVVLDEPTTALSLTETAKVFAFVERLKAAGKSVLFIGHNVQHVYDVADRFVVMDRGTNVLNIAKGNVQSALTLTAYMAEIAHGQRPEINGSL
jgi:simple sugar transport system ATP-binding protein